MQEPFEVKLEFMWKKSQSRKWTVRNGDPYKLIHKGIYTNGDNYLSALFGY